jgi:hypothetical protein
MPAKGLHFGVTEIDMKDIENTIKDFTALEATAAKLRVDITVAAIDP